MKVSRRHERDKEFVEGALDNALRFKWEIAARDSISTSHKRAWHWYSPLTRPTLWELQTSKSSQIPLRAVHVTFNGSLKSWPRADGYRSLSGGVTRATSIS